MTDAAEPFWAIVELMGHRQRAGLAAEVERFGTKLLRIDIPHAEGETSEYYGGAAIYCIRPCTEEVARAAAERLGDPRPVSPLAYRLAAPAGGFGAYDDDPEPV